MLGQACYGPEAMGCRRLYALVTNLPYEAVSRGRWNVGHEIAAQTVDLLHSLLRVAIATYRSHLARPGSVEIPEPYRVPRPDEGKPQDQPGRRFTRDSIRRALTGR